MLRRFERWMSLRVKRGALATGMCGILAIGLPGCVNQQQYDQLHSANRALQDRNVALQQELEARDSQIGLLRGRVGEGDNALRLAGQRNADLNSELVRIRERYRLLGDRLDGASLGVLDPKVDSALRQLAQRHPNIIRYDPSKGMVQFASDLTFASGSADLTNEARQTLQAFADILKTAEADLYDVRIVGHTDNVPIGRPETRAKHPTNMHLSVHRAISVRDELRKVGIAAERMEASGWGEFRPVVANPQRGGAAPNRRVEIFLVPSSRDASMPTYTEPTTTPEPAPTPQPREDFPMK